MNKVYHNEEERQKLISIFSSPQALDLVSGGVGTFQCKTCGKWFPSFQALGGHRTSHNRFPCRTKRALQLDLDIGKPVPAKRKKMKTAVHVCSVCGLEFSVGQALGGHMRRHNRKEKNSNNVGSLVTEDNAVMDSITGSSCSNHDNNNNNNDGASVDGSNSSDSSNGLCLELRLSPPDFDVGLLNLRLELGF